METINNEEMFIDEEYLIRISTLNRLYGQLKPEKKMELRQFMNDNDMKEVGELLDYLQEQKVQ